MSAPERRAAPGEVWQEADGCLLLCIEPGVWWQDFGGTRVPWDAPFIERPLRLVVLPTGEIAPTFNAAIQAAAWDQGYRQSTEDWEWDRSVPTPNPWHSAVTS